ncbi:DUF5056 domain-containing protein [Gilvimarinus polysaccharolyticus]|uniref:DUF5056 domain-containing protein n=1 Tax=Gilvimarinus polysaccharolyticus TaxID=863921 RepID=UPI0006738173|nr:DUF5056 domain-containing protein [Gilvimarinus polysaccharolyticus]
MSADKLDIWLEQTLAEQEPYLDDDGFSAAVMARLPVPVSRRRLLWANVSVAAVVMLLVAWVFPWGNAAAVINDVAAQNWLLLAAAISAVFTAAILAVGYWSYQRYS